MNQTTNIKTATVFAGIVEAAGNAANVTVGATFKILTAMMKNVGNVTVAANADIATAKAIIITEKFLSRWKIFGGFFYCLKCDKL